MECVLDSWRLQGHGQLHVIGTNFKCKYMFTVRGPLLLQLRHHCSTGTFPQQHRPHVPASSQTLTLKKNPVNLLLFLCSAAADLTAMCTCVCIHHACSRCLCPSRWSQPHCRCLDPRHQGSRGCSRHIRRFSFHLLMLLLLLPSLVAFVHARRCLCPGRRSQPHCRCDAPLH